MIGLKPYDPDAACPKCGRTPVPSRFCVETGEWPSFSFSFPRHPLVLTTEGHIHRTCGRCDYDWVELALDSKELTLEQRQERFSSQMAAIDAAREARA